MHYNRPKQRLTAAVAYVTRAVAAGPAIAGPMFGSIYIFSRTILDRSKILVPIL